MGQENFLRNTLQINGRGKSFGYLHHPLDQDPNTPLPYPILHTPKSGWAQKISLLKHSHVISQDPPSSSHLLWGPLAFPSRWTFPRAGSLLQVGVRSLELVGQPSWAGGRHRQRARRCSGNVLLVVPIPRWRVSALPHRDYDFPPMSTPCHGRHLYYSMFYWCEEWEKKNWEEIGEGEVKLVYKERWKKLDSKSLSLFAMSFQGNAGFSRNHCRLVWEQMRWMYSKVSSEFAHDWDSGECGSLYEYRRGRMRTLNQFSLLEIGLETPLTLCCPWIVWWSFLLPKWARAVEISVKSNRPR